MAIAITPIDSASAPAKTKMLITAIILASLIPTPSLDRR
jgi:hypothetical protein